jgi:hypothetical protein
MPAILDATGMSMHVRDAQMGAEETGLEQVDSGFEFCCFY